MALNAVLALILLYMLLFFTSCSKEFHFQRFVDKGGRIEKVETIIETPVYVPGKDGKDSLIYVKVKADCPEIDVPLTPAQKRRDARSERKDKKVDNKHEEKIASIESKKDVKINKDSKSAEVSKAKVESKGCGFVRHLKIFGTGAIAGFILAVILFLRFNFFGNSIRSKSSV